MTARGLEPAATPRHDRQDDHDHRGDDRNEHALVVQGVEERARQVVHDAGR